MGVASLARLWQCSLSLVYKQQSDRPAMVVMRVFWRGEGGEDEAIVFIHDCDASLATSQYRFAVLLWLPEHAPLKIVNLASQYQY